MKIALVTGASSGLGREYVLEISRAEPGIDEIWAVARRADRLEELKAVSRIPVRPVPADLTREEDIERIEALLEKTKPESRKNRGMQNASTTWMTPSGALLCNMKTPMMAMPLA